ALYRNKIDVGVPCGLPCGAVDSLSLNAQCAYRSDGQVHTAEHDSGTEIDRRRRLGIDGPGVVDRDIAFARLIVSGRLRSRRWCRRAAASATAATTSITYVTDRSTDTRTCDG